MNCNVIVKGRELEITMWSVLNWENLSCIHEQQIDEFISLIPSLIDFLTSKLESAQTMRSIINLLYYYSKIDSFLQISYIKYKKLCVKQMDKFKPIY